jgi:hypothetical protein
MIQYTCCMRPHPRIRKTIKWGGAAVTVLLVVVWIGSGWVFVTHSGGEDPFVEIRGGEFSFSQPGPGPVVSRTTCGLNAHRVCQTWLPRWNGGSSGGLANWHLELNIPLWLPVVAFAIPTAAAWVYESRYRRRAKLNLCPHCGYDRTGLAGGAGAVCPECGKLPA